MTRPDVLIVGGGLAGLSAAIRLADEGARVLLIETRKRLGGRATSFTDPRTGATLDNCQHVTMGCCVNYLAFCARLGASDKIRWTDSLHFVERGGRESVIRDGALPAPLHTCGSFLNAAFLYASGKREVARAMLAALRTDRSAWRDRVFLDWLTARGQSADTIDRFWSPVIVSACNLRVDRVCAAAALQVVQEGFLASASAGTIGVSTVPLVELYDPAERIISDSGGRVMLGASAACVDERAVYLSSGQRLDADRVVLAVPPERAHVLASESLAAKDGRLRTLRGVEHSPILGVHITLDRTVMTPPHAVLVGCGTQWVFNKGVAADGAQRLHAVISAADGWMALDEAAIVARVMDDLRMCFTDARNATVVHSRAVKERRATFAATPAFERSRPQAAHEDSALILAGDYTDTGWPATMEGAVRSGNLAAAAALGKPRDWALATPLPPSWLSSLLGGKELRRSLALTR